MAFFRFAHAPLIKVVFFFIFLNLSPLCAEPLQFNISGEAALLINAESGVILFAKNADKPWFPASTTKIATALFALNLIGTDLQTVVVAESESLKSVTEATKKKLNYQMPGYWLEPDGTHIRIKLHEELNLQALLEGLLICSGNDAANVIAQALGPTIPVFMERLNLYLKELGCLDTVYYNPHGLHHPQHVTTAHDLAKMTAVALKNPIFCQIVKKTRFERPKTNLQEPATFLQGNRLLRSGPLHYDKAIGVKTGYHSKAKKNLVGAAQLGNRKLIVVLLGYPNKNTIFEEAKKIFEMAFHQSEVKKIFLLAGLQEFQKRLPQTKNPVLTYTNEDLSTLFYPAEEVSLKCYLKWDDFKLPIKKDQKVGELYLKDAHETIVANVSVFAQKSVEKVWPYSWLGNLQNFYYNHPLISMLYLLCLVTVSGFCLLAKRR